MLRSLSSSPVGITCVALALSLAPAALAQTSASDTVKVTQLFKNGKAAFTKGDMAEAERLFSEAFAMRKSSDIAANLAQSELEQQKFRAAAEHFQWALVNLLPSASDAQRKAVETGLARSRSEVAVLRLDIKPEGSDVLVSEQNLGKSPIPGGVYVDPGEVIVSVKHDGYVAIDKRVLAAKGTEQAVEVSLVAKDSSPALTAAAPVDSGLQREPAPSAAVPPADAGAPHKSLVPAFIATGVAVAGGAAGVVFMLDANSKASKADDLRDDLLKLGGCGKGGGAPTVDCDTLNDQRKSVDSKRRLEIGAFVIGGVAAVAAGYFYWDALGQPSRGGASKQASATRDTLLPTFNLSQGDGTKVDAVKLGLRGTF